MNIFRNSAFRPILTGLVLVGLAWITPSLCSAEEWRGLRPYHSTRADVLNLFGQCADEDESRCYYNLPEEEVMFTFTGGCEHIPKDAIAGILVRPKTTISMDQYHRDLQKMNVIKNAITEPDFICYIDKTAGIIFRTLEGRVTEVEYFATAKQLAACKIEASSESDCSSVFARAHMPILCPLSKLIGPTEAVQIGTIVEVGIELSKVPRTSNTLLGQTGIEKSPLVYTWRVSDGRIVQGQGTTTIKVDTTGSRYPFIEVKLEIQGLAPECTGGYTVIVELHNRGNKRVP